MRNLISVLVLGVACLSVGMANAQPLPNHMIEGTGGIFTTGCAYLVNPAAEGEIAGLPSAGGFFLYLGNGRNLAAFTVTETLWDRLELSYGLNRLDLGDLPSEIDDAVGIRIGDNSVKMHNFNARLALVKEGACDMPWMPAITAGVHYKKNTDIDDIDDDLGGLLDVLGIEDDHGWDFTLYASKLITNLPRPVLLNAGVRATKAAHIGLFGFTDDYKFVGEGSAAVLVTDKLLLGGEFRQKPKEYHSVAGLIEDEDDWWTLFADYIFNDHLTATLAYGNLGHVLNHTANHAYGIQVKYEF